ncbi:MAG: glycosyltransferase family 4 protein, partial [Acidobacteria bacterium]|nr:glycosyltransferase family 4 protein [Acidobacteriota bacterium]
MSPKASLQRFLALTGKSERKVAAVFGISAAHSSVAVRYLNRECPGLPVLLFSLSEPSAETAARCESVTVLRDPTELLIEAQKRLWPYTIALTVVAWTRHPGGWILKWGPFAIPPFRTLVMNEHGDFFPLSPHAIVRHFGRRIHDVVTGLWPWWRDFHRALRFLIFTFIAVNFSAFARRAFRRNHGSAPLELPAIAPEGTAIVEFHYEMKRWNRAELLFLVANPRIRYILFLQGNARADISDILPLFDDPRTFAVARQSEHRGWQQMLLFRAPFRPLEPGSAAQTLAPIGRAMLVDRAKLAALGIPDTLVACAAWFLLFWRAACGGWRSYTAGTSGRTVICPDWPYEEGEFTARLLFDPVLKDKGPREPDLSRGNIAFPILGARPFRGLPRVLIVSPYLPYPLSHGGAVRIYNLCRALSARVDFLLACFKEKEDVPQYGKLLEVFREVYVLDIDQPASRDKSLPEQVRLHNSTSMHALIAELCASRSIDIVEIEYTHMAAFGAAAGDRPAILVEHDLTYSLYQQFAEQQRTAAAHAEFQRWLQFEQRAFARYPAVWVMSDEDRAKALEAGSSPASTFVIPNGVDVDRFTASPEPEGPTEIFYVGSFRHLPDILGFEKLRLEVMPRVWQRFPEVKLRVVAGPEPQRYWRELKQEEYPEALDPRIEIHSFVADLRPLYARASVVVVPLLVSAGTNIKVMEAMACRKAVVTTPVGCYGLGLVDGHDAIVRDSSAGFADAIITLLADPEL